MKLRSAGLRPRPRQGWLAAILPVEARTFRTSDGEVAAALASAGGELVDDAPDVEIASPKELVGDAQAAIVPIDAAERSDGRARFIRAADRLAGSLAVGRRAAAARRRGLRRGYAEATTVTWEPHSRLRPSLAAAPDARSFQRFPRHLVVILHRRARGPTAFEAAVQAAEAELGRRLEIGTILLGSSGVIVASERDVVLRVSIGPAAGRVAEQRAALESLRSADPSPFVSDRIPWALAAGSAGLAVWSLERRLPGIPSPPALAERLAADCVHFLCDLYAADGAGPDAGSPARDAEIAANEFAEHGEELRELGRRVEEALPSPPRGFGHGDFWTGNLLVENDSLAGVVDWPSAGPARLPLLDLMHLRANEVRERNGSHLAVVVLADLLPEARAGGHELDRAYCRRLGLKLSSRDLETLVGAYWLEELRRDLVDPDRDPDKPQRSDWRAAHLRVLDVLGKAHGIRVRS